MATMKIRPQVLAAMAFTTSLSGMGVFVGWQMEAVEVVTASITGGVAVLSALGMKLLETE